MHTGERPDKRRQAAYRILLVSVFDLPDHADPQIPEPIETY